MTVGLWIVGVLLAIFVLLACCFSYRLGHTAGARDYSNNLRLYDVTVSFNNERGIARGSDLLDDILAIRLGNALVSQGLTTRSETEVDDMVTFHLTSTVAAVTLEDDHGATYHAGPLPSIEAPVVE